MKHCKHDSGSTLGLILKQAYKTLLFDSMATWAELRITESVLSVDAVCAVADDRLLGMTLHPQRRVRILLQTMFYEKTRACVLTLVACLEAALI